MYYDIFIHLTISNALLVVLLGFIGGVLSGFIGSGGAFFMTPGMMNLGVSGVVSVGSNITHKFGKALVGSRQHAKLGNVDKKLAFFLLVTALIGIRLAVIVASNLFKGGVGHGAGKSAAADLYISAIFIGVLFFVGLGMLRDALGNKAEGEGPSRKFSEFVGRLRLPPVIEFPVSDVKVSAWILILVGLATGYLAGTIGVGGFIGVPAMIYVFGIPTSVATGTELYLALYMGLFGALNFAWEGLVDLRLTLLLYIGSLVGIHVGVYGVKVVRENVIRLVTGVIIILCVLSRAINVPVYMRKLHWITFDKSLDPLFNNGSTVLLFVAGIGGTLLILFHVIRGNLARRNVQKTLLSSPMATAERGAQR